MTKFALRRREVMSQLATIDAGFRTADAMNLLGVGEGVAYTLLRSLMDDGWLVQVGKSINTVWVRPEMAEPARLALDERRRELRAAARIRRRTKAAAVEDTGDIDPPVVHRRVSRYRPIETSAPRSVFDLARTIHG